MLFFTFILLFLFSVFSSSVFAQSQSINLNGVWKSSFGSTVAISQSGGVIEGTIKESKTASRVGTTEVRGSFEGGSFKGEVYLRAENRSCSFLDGYFPVTGGVSPDGNMITFTWENHIYNDETCNFTGEVRQGTLTYAKIVSQSSITPFPTTIQTITLQPTILFQTGKEIPGYVQAFVDKPPKASDFPEIPRSDFIKVYPVATISPVPRSATSSANSKDTIFVGKVGGEGKVVIGLPNGGTTVLKDDKSAYEGGMSSLSWRFGDTFAPPPERPYVKIVERDCHLEAAYINRNRNEPTIERDRYAEIWDAQTTTYKTVGDCTYLNEAAPVRVLVNQGNAIFKTLGGVAVSANKADFGIGYNAKSALSIVEVYNGSVEVSNNSGQIKKVSTVYGSRIKRVEIDRDGTMIEKIGVPQSEWGAFLASSQKKEKEVNAESNLPIVSVVLVLVMGGLTLFIYRIGKLKPLYEKFKKFEIKKSTNKTSEDI